MSEPAAIANHAAQRAGSLVGRVLRTWRKLPPERRLAAGSAIGLFFTLFLPWYQETVVAAGKSPSGASLTGWAAFSFVEAAVLVVVGGVLTLLFQRAEGRAFHLPGGDGGVITGAGVWTCVLVVWRILDKESVSVKGPGTTLSGVEWGIFVALAVATLLTYAGSRIRSAHTPEPPLPDDDVDWLSGDEAERRRRRASREARRARQTPTAAPPVVRETRRRAPRSDQRFPAPEPLADPPTLRLRNQRPASGTDEQLTIPFDET